jgi:hypothetical protein
MKPVSLSTMRWKLFLLGFFKIPMIHYVRPRIISCDDNNIQIKIPFRRRTKNHLNSMYFGALTIGADLSAGLMVFYACGRMNKKLSLAFKSVKGEFIKRPETAVFFNCSQGEFVREKLEEAIRLNERINFTLSVIATNDTNECVATFEMEVSIRVY